MTLTLDNIDLGGHTDLGRHTMTVDKADKVTLTRNNTDWGCL